MCICFAPYITGVLVLDLTINASPGDIQLIHNYSMLHDRSAFVDGGSPGGRRHLLRAWIAPDSPAARPLPSSFAQRFGTIEAGRRGGVHLDGAKPIARYIPPPRADESTNSLALSPCPRWHTDRNLSLPPQEPNRHYI